MPAEPDAKRAVAFFDGQNLFHAAKEAFGYSFPNFDPLKLAEAVCAARGWGLARARFYTGVPSAQDDPTWNRFWNAKLAVLGTRNVVTFSRPLRYQNRRIKLPDGREYTTLVGHEKGVDIRLALDVVRLALDGAFDVALLFSQDQDLSEVAQEIRQISGRYDRWIKIASAFPSSPTYRNKRGIDGTDWIRIDRATYDASLDPADYRPIP
jgi:uncharacterized LabA/DUF88 family protein